MELKDITPKNVINFVEGNILKGIDRMVGIPSHYKEQVIWRSILCFECTQKGKCVVCGCKTPNMFYSPRKVDSKKRWGQFMNEEAWNKFKETEEYKKVATEENIRKVLRYHGNNN